MIFEGPPPPFDDFLDQIRGRLHLVPRYRQKLTFPPLRDRPPAVGRRPELQPRVPRAPDRAARARARRSSCCNLVARIFSQQLDRSKPLWEMWLVEGLEAARFALISKTHHALIDGIAGVDLATVLFDLTPGAAEPSSTRRPRWSSHARADPGRAGRRRRVGAGAGSAARGRPRRWRRSRTRERAAARRARPPRALGEIVWAGLNPAPDDAAERRDRAAPALTCGALRARRLQADQERASAARSTTSCSTVVGGALRELAALARRAHRGPRAARARAGVDPRRRTSAASSATASPRCAARCPSTSRTRSRACASSREAMDEPQGVQAGGRAPRCSPASRTSRRRRSSPRPRG